MLDQPEIFEYINTNLKYNYDYLEVLDLHQKYLDGAYRSFRKWYWLRAQTVFWPLLSRRHWWVMVAMFIVWPWLATGFYLTTIAPGIWLLAGFDKASRQEIRLGSVLNNLYIHRAFLEDGLVTPTN